MDGDAVPDAFRKACSQPLIEPRPLVEIVQTVPHAPLPEAHRTDATTGPSTLALSAYGAVGLRQLGDRATLACRCLMPPWRASSRAAGALSSSSTK